MQVRASVASSTRLPQESLHSRPRHFHSKCEIRISPPLMCRVEVSSSAMYDTDDVLLSVFVTVQPSIELHTMLPFAIGGTRRLLGRECTTRVLVVVTA
jgi:hypothetical protein